MNEVELNKQANLSPHLASPSEAALSQTNELDGLRLSPHFTLAELTKTSYHTLDGKSVWVVGDIERTIQYALWRWVFSP